MNNSNTHWTNKIKVHNQWRTKIQVARIVTRRQNRLVPFFSFYQMRFDVHSQPGQLFEWICGFLVRFGYFFCLHTVRSIVSSLQQWKRIRWHECRATATALSKERNARKVVRVPSELSSTHSYSVIIISLHSCYVFSLSSQICVCVCSVRFCAFFKWILFSGEQIHQKQRRKNADCRVECQLSGVVWMAWLELTIKKDELKKGKWNKKVEEKQTHTRNHEQEQQTT